MNLLMHHRDRCVVSASIDPEFFLSQIHNDLHKDELSIDTPK